MCTKNFLTMIADTVFNIGVETKVPETYYLGLGSQAPNEDGTNTQELSGGGYQRIEITGLTEATDGVVKNGEVLSFPESTGPQGTATYYYIYGQKENGELLMYGELEDPRTIENKTVVSIKAGELVLSVVNVTTE